MKISSGVCLAISKEPGFFPESISYGNGKLPVGLHIKGSAAFMRSRSLAAGSYNRHLSKSDCKKCNIYYTSIIFHDKLYCKYWSQGVSLSSFRIRNRPAGSDQNGQDRTF